MVGRDAEMSSGVELLLRLAAGAGCSTSWASPGLARAGWQRNYASKRRQGCTWQEGRCVSYGESLPCWPYRDLLRNWLEVSTTDPVLRVRAKLQRKIDEAFADRGAEVYPYLATVIGLSLEPETAAQLAPLASESVQYRPFEVVGELIQKLAARPLVVALDDLHWADPTSPPISRARVAAAQS